MLCLSNFGQTISLTGKTPLSSIQNSKAEVTFCLATNNEAELLTLLQGKLI